MTNNFPTIGEYNQLFLKKGGSAFRTLRGITLIPARTTPVKVFLFGSGTYAAVFKGSFNGKLYAIRCFLSAEENTLKRHEIICDYMTEISSNWKVDYEFINDEIICKDKSYPILKMEWVNGDLINNFITKNIHNNNLLSEIQEQLINISNDLESHNIGHGDLQCGNIIIEGDSHRFQIKLIDYDGLYVPKLINKGSIELGRSEFQHPMRHKNYYNKEMDRFSFWVMLTALEALKHDKSLWLEVMQGGFNTLDNFLFTIQDFRSPDRSNLFNRLYKIKSTELNFYLDKLKWFCNNDISLLTPPVKKDYTSNSNLVKGSEKTSRNGTTNKQSKDQPTNKFKIISISGTATVLTASFVKIGETPLELDKDIYLGKTIIISNGSDVKQIVLNNYNNVIEVELKLHEDNGLIEDEKSRVIEDNKTRGNFEVQPKKYSTLQSNVEPSYFKVNFAIFIIVSVLVGFLVYNYIMLSNNNSLETTTGNISENDFIKTEYNYSQIIEDFINAEENRDFENIYSFFSDNLVRYYNLYAPSYDNLKKRYNQQWSFTNNSKNYIKKIDKISDSTYDLHTKFDYYHLKQKALFTTESIVRFVFDDKGKIISIYGLEEFENMNNTISKKIFYDEKWNTCLEYEAKYYRIITLDDMGTPIGQVKDYYITGELQWEGNLSYVGENQDFDVLEGECTWYYKNGNKRRVANYKNGELNGSYTTFDENGKVYSVSYYVNDELVAIDFATNN